jgi:hypothetical protein
LNRRKRIEALERLGAIRTAVSPPEIDYRELLIQKVSRIAERAEYWGETPAAYEGDPGQVVATLCEWIRMKVDEP